MQIQFCCLKNARKKKNVNSSVQPQINVFPMSLYFINQDLSQIFLRTEAQSQTSEKRRKIDYSSVSIDLSMLVIDFFRDSLQNQLY